MADNKEKYLSDLGVEMVRLDWFKRADKCRVRVWLVYYNYEYQQNWIVASLASDQTNLW